MIHIFFLLLLLAILTPHYWINSCEHQYSIVNRQQIDDFPFELGKDLFNNEMEVLFRDVLRKKSLPVTSLALLTQDQKVLFSAQQLYNETKNNDLVREYFVQAKKSSFNGEALWEWQIACSAVNKTLQQKIKELALCTINLKKAELEQIFLVAHFAFQQNKYMIEKYICQQSNREHIHRWFVAHNYKGKL